MTVTVASFRASQAPAFNNAALYPDARVQFYLDLAGQLTNSDRWGDLLDFGQTLMVAHFLALNQLGSVGGVGGVPGSAVGVLNRAQVDKVSYGRDIAAVMEPGAGHWNMTVYGLEYRSLVRMVGAGPLQVGTPGPGESAAGAWYGPWIGPW